MAEEAIMYTTEQMYSDSGAMSNGRLYQGTEGRIENEKPQQRAGCIDD